MTTKANSLLAFIVLLFCLSAAGHEFRVGKNLSHVFPPQKPERLPVFSVPMARQTLDDGWQFDTLLVDAPGHPELYNAFPVELCFTHENRGYLACLHTVFRTYDGGRTWTNLDPNPPPFPSQYSSLRAPAYISALKVRPVAHTAAAYDSLYLTTMRGDTSNRGAVRLIYILGGQYTLQGFTPLERRIWLTALEVMDSLNAVAFAGQNARIYWTDSLAYRNQFGGNFFGTWDSVAQNVGNGWIAGSTAWRDSLIIAVGTQQWVSRDRGRSWNVAPAADSVFDYGVSFSDSLHGITGGGTLSPPYRGWTHRTTDGGRTWSGRTLEGVIPVRAVDMVNDSIAFAGGGDYVQGIGGLWSSTDGGASWTFELNTHAEIRSIGHRRVNAAYVDVFAVGGFPDFTCGVWRQRLFLPDNSGPVLLPDPDSLFFGTHAHGSRDTLYTTLRNLGSDLITITSIFGGDTTFVPLNAIENTTLNPGDTLLVPVVFFADAAGTRERVLTVGNLSNQTVEIFCQGIAEPGAGVDDSKPLPKSEALAIWPNPGNQQFQISFELEHTGQATLTIFDLNGRLVETLTGGNLAAGKHVLSWDAASHASGVYFARLTQPTGSVTRKLLLLK